MAAMAAGVAAAMTAAVTAAAVEAATAVAAKSVSAAMASAATAKAAAAAVAAAVVAIAITAIIEVAAVAQHAAKNAADDRGGEGSAAAPVVDDAVVAKQPDLFDRPIQIGNLRPGNAYGTGRRRHGRENCCGGCDRGHANETI